jgi:hypothetical protein
MLNPAIKMRAEKAKDVPSVYSEWFGKSVLLLVAFRQCHLPLPCRIVGETAANVRIHVEPGWEIDVRKELILAVEERAACRDSLIN